MPFLQVNDGKIFYEVLGNRNGEWITLINGHTRSHRDFRALAKRLVENDYCVLLLDNRGSGSSEAINQFSIEDMAFDIVAIWRELKVNRSVLLGISMGGQIAQVLSSEHPHLVSKLILVSTCCDARWIIREEGFMWSDELNGLEHQLFEYFERAFAERNKLLIKAMAKGMLEQGIVRFNERAQMQRVAMRGFDIRSALLGSKAVNIPALLIHGKSDRIIDYRAASELSSIFSHNQLVILEDRGHLLLAEAPRELCQLILDFICLPKVQH